MEGQSRKWLTISVAMVLSLLSCASCLNSTGFSLATATPSPVVLSDQDLRQYCYVTVQLLGDDDYQGAVAMATEGIAKAAFPSDADPSSLAELYDARALANAMLHEYDNAEEDAHKACDLSPHAGMAWFTLGAIQSLQDKHSDAINAFSAAIDNAVDSVEESDYRWARASEYYETGDYTSSLQDARFVSSETSDPDLKALSDDLIQHLVARTVLNRIYEDVLSSQVTATPRPRPTSTPVAYSTLAPIVPAQDLGFTCDHCIKGNIAFGTGERIYHIPGCDYYAETEINTDYGERWFSSEAEAIAAGWRKAYNCP